jgi:CPA2 family monovalent cation:H+ antiporter-2
MESHGSDITSLALVALAALGCGMAMRFFRQPPVLGYILAGAFLGPSGFALVGNRANVQVLAELGVLMLLFVIGMELSLRGIREVWKVAVLTTALQIVVGVGGMYALGLILEWPLGLSIVLGFVVAISSTAVAIKMLEEIGQKDTRVGQITIGILIAQDLAVVPMMLLVSSFDREAGSIGLDAILKIAFSVTFLALLIFYLSRRERLRLPFIRQISNSIDLMPLAGMGFCFGAAALSGLLGLSAAYGAFLAGLVIGNSTSRTGMIRYTGPIQSILLMVFFLSIGLLIDFRYIWENIGTVVLIVTFVAVLKTALNIGLIRAFGETWPRAFLSGALLAQLGEFSFILAAMGLSAGVVSWENHRLLVSVTVISLLFSPFWLEASRRLHRVVLLGITSGSETIRLTFGP